MIAQSLSLLFLSSTLGIAAFAPSSLPRTHRKTVLYEAKSSPSSSALPEDLERERQRFEEIFEDHSISSQIFPDRAVTSVSRHRCLVEMDLLNSLRDSDDAVEELLHLWITERDEESAEQIFQMQEQCSDGLVEENRMLREMMERHPTWAEPVLRLATLLYYKGCTEESYDMALRALELKPWHMEAPQLLVLLALRKQDMGQAVFWARHGLPPLRGAQGREDSSSAAADEFKPTLKRRRQWVERALKQAKDQLAEAELSRVELARSQSDDYEHAAWQ